MSGPKIERLAIAELTKGLRPNELRAVTSWARGETLDEAGRGIGLDGRDVSRERARQLALKALRRMRRNAALKGITLSDVAEPT